MKAPTPEAAARTPEPATGWLARLRQPLVPLRPTEAGDLAVAAIVAVLVRWRFFALGSLALALSTLAFLVLIGPQLPHWWLSSDEVAETFALAAGTSVLRVLVLPVLLGAAILLLDLDSDPSRRNPSLWTIWRGLRGRLLQLTLLMLAIEGARFAVVWVSVWPDLEGLWFFGLRLLHECAGVAIWALLLLAPPIVVLGGQSAVRAIPQAVRALAGPGRASLLGAVVVVVILGTVASTAVALPRVPSYPGAVATWWDLDAYDPLPLYYMLTAGARYYAASVTLPVLLPRLVSASFATLAWAPFVTLSYLAYRRRSPRVAPR